MLYLLWTKGGMAGFLKIIQTIQNLCLRVAPNWEIKRLTYFRSQKPPFVTKLLFYSPPVTPLFLVNDLISTFTQSLLIQIGLILYGCIFSSPSLLPPYPQQPTATTHRACSGHLAKAIMLDSEELTQNLRYFNKTRGRREAWLELGKYTNYLIMCTTISLGVVKNLTTHHCWTRGVCNHSVVFRPLRNSKVVSFS